jgi:hypothetical protein
LHQCGNAAWAVQEKMGQAVKGSQGSRGVRGQCLREYLLHEGLVEDKRGLPDWDNAFFFFFFLIKKGTNDFGERERV